MNINSCIEKYKYIVGDYVETSVHAWAFLIIGAIVADFEFSSR